MTRLYPSDLAAFARKYRFAGGRLRKLTVRFRKGTATVTFELAVRPATQVGDGDQPVRLRFRLDGADEFRFQKRPTAAGGAISDARFGYFGDVYYVNLDAYGLERGETPKLHDFRGSDAYLGGRELYWEVVAPAAG